MPPPGGAITVIGVLESAVMAAAAPPKRTPVAPASPEAQPVPRSPSRTIGRAARRAASAGRRGRAAPRGTASRTAGQQGIRRADGARSSSDGVGFAAYRDSTGYCQLPEVAAELGFMDNCVG
jgi:hypothetical protein